MADIKPGPPGDQRPKHRRRPLWVRLLRLAVIGYVTWCATLMCSETRMLFPRDLAPVPLKHPYDRSTVELTRLIDGGEKVVAWLIPPRDAAERGRFPLVVYFHGNAEIIDYSDHVVQGYQQFGCSVLLPEFRGYGRSGGKPSERAIVDDAAWFLAEALTRPDVDGERVVFHGRSLGGGVAAGLAARHPPAALILESTFISVASMAAKYAAPAFLVRNKFRVDRVVQHLDVPIFVMHGTHDDIIPVEHGRSLSRLARRGTYVEFDCMHNDFPGDANIEAYWEHVGAFLRQHDIVRP